MFDLPDYSPGCLLVTGASGFLGRAVVSQAKARGWNVRATSRRRGELPADVDFHSASIIDPKALERTVRGADAVIHCAGLAHVTDRGSTAEALFYRVNRTGTENVVRAAVEAGVRRIVIVSSVAVYGHSATVCDEDSPCRPNSAYGQSKFEGERRAAEIAHRSGVLLTILRPATLYGEGAPGNVARLIRAIDRRRFIWLGRGENRKTLVHVEDAARACLLAIAKMPAGLNVYNVSSPSVTMRHIVEALAHALGKQPPRWHIPAWLARRGAWMAGRLLSGAGLFRSLENTIDKWLCDDVFSGTKIERELGFVPQVDLADGLRRQVQAYRGLAGPSVPRPHAWGHRQTPNHPAPRATWKTF